MKRALGQMMLCVATLPPVRAREPVALFDGRDTAKWHMFLRDHDKVNDPNAKLPCTEKHDEPYAR